MGKVPDGSLEGQLIVRMQAHSRRRIIVFAAISRIAGQPHRDIERRTTCHETKTKTKNFNSFPPRRGNTESTGAAAPQPRGLFPDASASQLLDSRYSLYGGQRDFPVRANRSVG